MSRALWNMLILSINKQVFSLVFEQRTVKLDSWHVKNWEPEVWERKKAISSEFPRALQILRSPRRTGGAQALGTRFPCMHMRQTHACRKLWSVVGHVKHLSNFRAKKNWRSAIAVVLTLLFEGKRSPCLCKNQVNYWDRSFRVLSPCFSEYA